MRIMARGDHDTARGIPLADKKRDCWRRTGFVGQPNRCTGRTDNLRHEFCHGVRFVAVIVSDQHTAAWIFRANNITSNRVPYDAGVLESEVLTNHAAPAVGAKLDGSHLTLSIREAGNPPKIAGRSGVAPIWPG